MKKILFLIHDLGVGGAEKVLVNLVNHLDRSKFKISVISLFGGGVNEQFLLPDINYHAVWPRMIPGNSKIMKLFTPRQLHNICVKEQFDIEVSFLEGPAARVISGCPNINTRLFCWIHVEQLTQKSASGSFRSYKESLQCYERFEKIVCVSEAVKQDFLSLYPEIKKAVVRYNTIETSKITAMKDEAIDDIFFSPTEINLISVGRIKKQKGFDRLARVVKRLRIDGLPVHLYVLGVGPEQPEIETWLRENEMTEYYSFLGYKLNPYKYVSRCDLFVCASLAEGYSTAATEALIVGTPVCTVEVSGMKEMLGDNDEFGVVTENNEDELYKGIKRLLSDPELLMYYRKQAAVRGKDFLTDNTVKAVEDLFSPELVL